MESVACIEKENPDKYKKKPDSYSRVSVSSDTSNSADIGDVESKKNVALVIHNDENHLISSSHNNKKTYDQTNNISNSVDLNEIKCEINNVGHDEPSTSGISKELASKLTVLKLPKSELDTSEDEDHSHYETLVSQNFTDVAVTRERPSSLPFHKGKRRVLKISPEDISSPDSPMSDEEMNKYFSPDTDSQDEMENSILEQLHNKIPELTVEEERADMKSWKACTIGGIKRQIDMKVIEPYKRVLSHGGYLTTGSHNAIITFSACFLPHKSRVDYNYVMDNLFFYVLYTLNQLVTDDYVLVYLHGGTPKDCIPKFSWLKRCYQMIDRKLKKNLKALYLVHPTFWLKTLVYMIKPFISSKFSHKMHFIHSLAELYDTLPIEEASIPDKVKQYDRIKLSLRRKEQ
ncbi:protein prune homolog 2 [Planococcus citri]|uniref:protein prune homolog 2 n=1 Tax=Planococcus citri TaxID=170843 RepID=UPI0031F9C098